MGTDAAGGILQGLNLALGQQVLDEAVGTHVGAQRRRRGGLQSHGAVQPAQLQQSGDLPHGLVGMIGIGKDPVGLRWTRELRQVAMRESCSYMRHGNRSSQ